MGSDDEGSQEEAGDYAGTNDSKNGRANAMTGPPSRAMLGSLRG
eukprot:CAMPEP_0172569552 /NCGR_PEP_ID=MMETSP1067-20121228/123971_1 /TAXON_ID=265564 ORGANISM="Thalassiosira punctigera, Strain Tpunct2005C2" /NCGR_SAMPLE_ID=MMETSP1067 /ASSEMBLY_ACC=CAM_ASM_000444 /LENGTH=43 /DNA_ID= /DNA_START= /DNA_END= /DNA_ORIENTATION=